MPTRTEQPERPEVYRRGDAEDDHAYRSDEVEVQGVGGLLQAVRSIPGFARLLYRLMKDSRVSGLDRALFAFTLGYVFTPVDVIPDWIPLLGALDDLLLVVLALDRLLYRTDPAVLREHWEGDPEPLYRLRGAVEWASDALPGWARRLVRGP